MKKLALLLSLVLLLGGCSSTVSSRHDELAAQYDFYQQSVKNLQNVMEVDPDQADSIFLILVDYCNISKEINAVNKNPDGTFSAWSDGTSYTVSLENGAVSSVTTTEWFDTVQLYPETSEDGNNAPEPHNNFLMDCKVNVCDVMNGSGTEVIGQRAYIEVSARQLGEITSDALVEFAKNRVENSDYNWVSIIADNGNGILFTGSNITLLEYGKLDKEGMLEETIGFISLSDGVYTYSES